MNTMKFYKTRPLHGFGVGVKARELVTLRVEIDQRVGQYHHNETRGKSRRDACALARSGGFYRTKAEAFR